MAIFTRDLRTNLYADFHQVMLEGLIWHIDADMRGHDCQGLSKRLIELATKASPKGEGWEGEEIGFPADIRQVLNRGLNFLDKHDFNLALGTTAKIRQVIRSASLVFLSNEDDEEFGEILETLEHDLFERFASSENFTPVMVDIALTSMRAGSFRMIDEAKDVQAEIKKQKILLLLDQSIDKMGHHLTRVRMLAHAMDTNIDWNYDEGDGWSGEGEHYHSKWSAQFLEVIQEMPALQAAEFLVSIDSELTNSVDTDEHLRDVLDEAAKKIKNNLRAVEQQRLHTLSAEEFLSRQYT
jgi:hypothetical protein